MIDSLPPFDDLLDIHRPHESGTALRALLPAAQASGNEAYLGELLTQIARTEGLQGHFEAAHELLNEANAVIRDDMLRADICFLLERGRIFNSSGSPGEARPLFLGAWDLARQCEEEYLAVDAAHMLGIIEPARIGLCWNLCALQIAEGSNVPHVKTWLGPLYHNIGRILHDLGEYAEALEYFRLGLQWLKAQEKPRDVVFFQSDFGVE